MTAYKTLFAALSESVLAKLRQDYAIDILNIAAEHGVMAGTVAGRDLMIYGADAETWGREAEEAIPNRFDIITVFAGHVPHEWTRQSKFIVSCDHKLYDHGRLVLQWESGTLGDTFGSQRPLVGLERQIAGCSMVAESAEYRDDGVFQVVLMKDFGQGHGPSFLKMMAEW